MVDSKHQDPGADATPRALVQRLLFAAGPILGLVLLLLAVWVLRREFRTFRAEDILAQVRSIPPAHLLAALGLTLLGYWILTGYDALALRFVGSSLPHRRIALVSFVSYVFTHNFGLAAMSGGAVRYRMLSAWGIKAEDIARIIAFTLLTFWMGFFLLGGTFNLIWPHPLPGALFATSRTIGLLLLLVIAGYLAMALVRRRPLSLHGFRIDLPDPRTTGLQLAVATADWIVAAAVLYVVLPDEGKLSFPVFAGTYLLAQILGMISHVPGGLGVFEGAMVLQLKPWIGGDRVLAALLAYRLVYYLLPLVAAVLLFAGHELRQRRAALGKVGSWFQGWVAPIVPHLMAVTVFLAGALMLFSGAAPELPERLEWLRRMLPMPLIEVSKLLGSVIGVGLLVLANALRLRLDAAYLGTLGLLFFGALASLVKGLDWEEASTLLAMALILLPCRSFFRRRSSLLHQPLAATWWTAVAAVAAGALITLELAYRHVAYSHELWWHFGPEAQAPRSMRALVAAGVCLLAVGALRLLRPAPPAPGLPGKEELDRAQEIAARSPATTGFLSLLGDKHLLFHEAGDAFLMYGISGRTWVSMGDPVGPEEHLEDLAWTFREMADRHGAKAVFYEVSERELPLYLDLGLDLRKLGEDARVRLADFSLEGSSRKNLRRTQARLAREGCTFEVIPAQEVTSVLDELERISGAWLAEKKTREKGFSLGFFDPSYLLRLPVALVRREGCIVAFANLWPSGTKSEVTIDLMRYDEHAPPGVMEYLFTQLMLWAQSEGFEACSLGMAPLSGFEHRPLAPLWNRFGALIFRYGEHFYNFQGLRAFKEKFDPEWEPRFLAAPGGLATPLVFTRIASLVSGSLRGVLSK
ncbi:MAG: bifunctional lysylphosphatidylglycerol flippase/synthetase MprF [Acidobacteria bacterium]|nr:bifunctional lysylphosphatidylglycerol flippase/synthetase MprF [Acidobacteriota bacterium]